MNNTLPPKSNAALHSKAHLFKRIAHFPLVLGTSLLKKIGWFNTTLRMRMVLLACVIMILQALASATLGLRLYWQDRNAYLFENHELRAELVYIKLQQTILRHVKPDVFSPLNSEPAQLKLNYGIPRLPEQGELFVGALGGASFVFWRTEKQELLMSRFEFSPDLCPSDAGMCYLVSGNGVFLK
jgi:hypothetical protein